MSLLIKGVSLVGKGIRSLRIKDSTPLWKSLKLPAPYHGDFRPDLLQDVDLFHLHVPFYQKWTDSVRVRMATRKMTMEENSKFIPQIYNIVDGLTKEFLKRNEIDINTVRVREVRGALPIIISELSYNIFVQEHRLKYQSEQKNRHAAAMSKFMCSSYFWQNKTLEEFVKDYNKFLWCEINKSHLYLSPKIEANYRRNYHDGEISQITSAVFFLYFQTDKVKRFFSKLLMAAFRDPHTRRTNLNL